MNKEISNILKDRLCGLPFVEQLGGMVQTVEFKQPNGDNNVTTKRMPISCDAELGPKGKATQEMAFVPNSKKLGILYFEDLGISFVDRVSGGAIQYKSRLILVCWMNRARLTGNSYTEISSYCITSILGKLKIKTIANECNFSRFMVTPGRILQQDSSVFSRYTYDESITQYLRPPFEFFGIELTVDYCIHPDCLNDIKFKEPVCY